MEEREMKEFSWSIFFCVSAVCFFAFSFALKMLDAGHTGFFVRAGLVFTVLGVLAILNNWLGDKRTGPHSPHQESF